MYVYTVPVRGCCVRGETFVLFQFKIEIEFGESTCPLFN